MPASHSSASALLHRALLALAVTARVEQAGASPGASASDDEKVSCIEAFEQAQQERAATHLLAAQQHLLVCTRAVCGTSLMSECTQMYADIERALPSVVLSAHDEATNTDLTEVEVTVDGRPLATSLDGRPIPIDPGEYDFVFSTSGHEPVTRKAVVGMGDQYRSISVVFTDPKPPAPEPAASRAPQPAASTAEPRPGVPVVSWVLGGIAVAGVGTGTVLRVISNSDFDAMKEGCASRGCPRSDIDKLEQKYVLSSVAFGVGAAAAAGAVLWYVLDRPSTERGSLAVVPSADGRGAFATAQGRF